MQTLPSVVIGLYTRWFHRHALLLGWLFGIVAGTAMVASTSFATSVYPLDLGGYAFPCYAALASLVLNLVVSAVLTPVFNIVLRRVGDETSSLDYQEA